MRCQRQRSMRISLRGAAGTKYHNRVAVAGVAKVAVELKRQKLFSPGSGGWKPRLKCQQGWFLLRPLSLAHGWPSFYLCLHSSFIRACVFISSSYEDTDHVELGPTPMTQFGLIYLSMLFSYSYSVWHLGLSPGS